MDVGSEFHWPDDAFPDWERDSSIFPDFILKEDPDDPFNTGLILDEDMKPTMGIDIEEFQFDEPEVAPKEKPRRVKKATPKQTRSRSRENKVLVSRPGSQSPIVRCEICGVIFGTRRSLLYHMKVHDVRPAHKCTVCSKEFGRKSTLRMHSRIHSGHYPVYKCNVCLKTLKTSNGLAYHVRTHTDFQLSCCYICGNIMTPDSQLAKSQVQVCKTCLLKYR